MPDSSALAEATLLQRRQTRAPPAAGNCAAGMAMAMAFKLNEAASERWRYVSSPRLATLVRADAKSGKRVLIERPDEAESKVAA
jgi:hypothetical protein